MTDDKPIWRYWINLAEVPLEDAVCLSLDFEPSVLRKSDTKPLSPDRAERLETARAHCIVRRDAARTHIKAKNLPARRDQFKKTHLVRLADFRQWGERLPEPISFPEAFPRTLPVLEAAAAGATASPRSDNANLRVIAAMLALLRDQDGGRFPSDAKIIDLLVQRNGAADGVSKRNLEAVFAAAKRAADGDLQPKTKRRK